MTEKGPWDKPPKPVDHMNPPDRNAPPAGLTNDELETSNYYRDGTPLQIILSWALALVASVSFWGLIVWALFFKKG